MDIQNMRSKESVGVKFKDGICAEFYLKLWFEIDWYFLILLSQHGFESDCPETRFQIITSWSQFEKATVKKSITGTIIPNQMIK